MEKLVILGTGVAGLTAAIYAATAELSPLLISGPEDGGQLTTTTAVENFPGFPEGVQGPALINLMKKQAVKFGAHFKEDMVTEFNVDKKRYTLTLMNGEKIQSQAVIIATGASARWLGLPSEKKYKGRGVSVCATCDAAFFKNKEVLVIGGGDSAMEESLLLSQFASKVTVVHRRDVFTASKIMQERFLANKKCKVIWNSEVQEYLGDGKKLTGVKLKDKAGKTKEIKCDGVFLAIGHTPNTGIFKDKVDMDELGYLKTDGQTHTNLPGVFAAGDVQDRRYKQAVTAAGTGCMAALEAQKYLGG